MVVVLGLKKVEKMQGSSAAHLAPMWAAYWVERTDHLTGSLSADM